MHCHMFWGDNINQNSRGPNSHGTYSQMEEKENKDKQARKILDNCRCCVDH